MNLPACIWLNQQNLFPCPDWGTCDCDWWVPLSMWDNADKRSNLICPVGSWILLAVYAHFFMCGTLHWTRMTVYLVLCNCSLLTAGCSLLLAYIRNVSCELLVPQSWTKWHVRIMSQERLACSSMQWPNWCRFLSFIYASRFAGLSKILLVIVVHTSYQNRMPSTECWFFCGNKQILLSLFLSGHSWWCYLLVVGHST